MPLNDLNDNDPLDGPLQGEDQFSTSLLEGGIIACLVVICIVGAVLMLSPQLNVICHQVLTNIQHQVQNVQDSLEGN